jgi:hypothetical protein
VAYVDHVDYSLPASEPASGGGSDLPALHVGAYPAVYSAPTFSPASFAGDTNQFMRAIAGAQNAPFSAGLSAPVAPLWAATGDMDTMSITGSLSGGFGLDGGAVGTPKVDDSFQSRMAATMALPDGQPDWGKWIIIAGVFVALYLIGRETGRKGPQS